MGSKEGPPSVIEEEEVANTSVVVERAGNYVYELFCTDPAGRIGTARVRFLVHAAEDTVPTALIDAPTGGPCRTS